MAATRMMTMNPPRGAIEDIVSRGCRTDLGGSLVQLQLDSPRARLSLKLDLVDPVGGKVESTTDDVSFDPDVLG